PVRLQPCEIEGGALAWRQVLEVDELDAGLDLRGRVALGEDVGIAAAERAGWLAAQAGQRAHADVVDVALVYRGDLVVDVIGRGDVHSELAGTELRLEGSPRKTLRGAHGAVGEPQRVQRLQDRQA